MSSTQGERKRQVAALIEWVSATDELMRRRGEEGREGKPCDDPMAATSQPSAPAVLTHERSPRSPRDEVLFLVLKVAQI